MSDSKKSEKTVTAKPRLTKESLLGKRPPIEEFELDCSDFEEGAGTVLAVKISDASVMMKIVEDAGNLAKMTFTDADGKNFTPDYEICYRAALCAASITDPQISIKDWIEKISRENGQFFLALSGKVLEINRVMAKVEVAKKDSASNPNTG